MDLFGVQDLGTVKTASGPGYAYVPDLGPSTTTAGPGRKRAAAIKRVQGTAAEHTSAQDAKILRELAALDKESHREVQIPVPIRARDAAGRGKRCAPIIHYCTSTCVSGC